MSWYVPRLRPSGQAATMGGVSTAAGREGGAVGGAGGCSELSCTRRVAGVAAAAALTWRRRVGDVEQVEAVHRRHGHHVARGIERQLRAAMGAGRGTGRMGGGAREEPGGAPRLPGQRRSRPTERLRQPRSAGPPAPAHLEHGHALVRDGGEGRSAQLPQVPQRHCLVGRSRDDERSRALKAGDHAAVRPAAARRESTGWRRWVHRRREMQGDGGGCGSRTHGVPSNPPCHMLTWARRWRRARQTRPPAAASARPTAASCRPCRLGGPGQGAAHGRSGGGKGDRRGHTSSSTHAAHPASQAAVGARSQARLGQARPGQATTLGSPDTNRFCWPATPRRAVGICK